MSARPAAAAAMPTPDCLKQARAASQQPPESGHPAASVNNHNHHHHGGTSSDRPAAAAAAVSTCSLSHPGPSTPAASNGLGPPLANGEAGIPPVARPPSSSSSSSVCIPDPGTAPTSPGSATTSPPTTTTTSTSTALTVAPLTDHTRQNQAAPSSLPAPVAITGAGGQPRTPTAISLLPPSSSSSSSPAATAMIKTVAASNQVPAPARPPAPTVQRITVSSPHMKAPPLTPTAVPVLQNFQVPAGMVLVRSDSGQLVLVPQKAIAQAQAQAKARAQAHGTGNASSAAPASKPSIRISTVQATGTQIISKQVKPSTVQQVNQLQAAAPTTAVPQRITLVQPQTTGGAVAAKTVTTVTQKPAVTPAGSSVTAPVLQTSASPETLENVKKCKNFLATLIKLASSGSHSPLMSNNVKALVQKLLDGKLEAEEFTNQLYKELKSSPQPYLVPFLKRSLPALRKSMPNSQAFIQQCLQKPATPATTLASAAAPGATKQPNLGQATRTITVTSASQQAKLLQALPSTQMVVQQSGVLLKSQASTLPRTQTVTLQRPPNHITVPVSQIQVKSVQGGPATSVIKVPLVQGYRNPASVLLQASPGQKIKKEVGGIPFRDEDDINDVASMAGVNISEENARILATNSELVGAVIRSCKDEAFLSSVSLQKKTLEIGKRHGVTEVNSDVLSTISHATQERLRELVEKLTVIARHRLMVYKEDDRYNLLNDTRSQLKFFEQLDRLEKQRKDEDERETMLRLARSRAKQEDPEQLRLKQKAKEMQQLELAQLQQREANLAALAAIGPRKRKAPDSPGLGTGRIKWQRECTWQSWINNGSNVPTAKSNAS
ncbi:transcription initiation factor TFIID subunit 4-like isoform X2 [Heptranchias perlo]|uniref:transcription initiation factor TFIID subunit 4-like isoform X2 n=1 Tax=Heptranchias perlo TaxID=212740 RepID=UPI003559E3A1